MNPGGFGGGYGAQPVIYNQPYGGGYNQGYSRGGGALCCSIM